MISLLLTASIALASDKITTKPIEIEKVWGRGAYKTAKIKARLVEPVANGYEVVSPILTVTVENVGAVQLKYEDMSRDLTDFKIDTANYQITPKDTAFAVRMATHTLYANGNSNNEETFELFSAEAGKLRHILTRSSVHEHEELRDESYNENVHETYSMTKQMTDGHYDIDVTIRAEGKKTKHVTLTWKNGAYVDLKAAKR